MPRGIKKYRGPFGAMPGPLYNTEGEAGGGGAATKTDDPKPKPPAAQTPASDEELGEGGKKALEREREARKLLERQLQGMQGQMAAIAQAFGVKPDGSDDGGQLVETLQQQVAAMQHQSMVDRVARAHGITDAGDLEFLASAKDEEQMARFAARLNAAAAPATPKPDASQGPKGGDNKPDPGPGVARLAAAFEDEFNK